MGGGSVAVGDLPDFISVWPVDVLVVNDREVCARCKDLAKAGQNHGKVHPVQAHAARDEPVRRGERRILSAPQDPTEASVASAGKAPALCDHRRGRVERIDPLSECGHRAGERSGARAGIKDGAWRLKTSLQHREHCLGIGRATTIKTSDHVVREDLTEAAHAWESI